MDLLFIAILSILTWRCTTNKGIGDAVGCIIVALVLYCLVKTPFILLFGGATFPVSQNFNDQLASGIIAFGLVGSLLFYVRKKKQRIERGKHV